MSPLFVARHIKGAELATAFFLVGGMDGAKY